MQPIAFIYFDLGNVLLRFSHQRACDQIAAESGLTAKQVWQGLFDSGLQTKYETGSVSSDALYHQFCSETGACLTPEAFWIATSDIFELNLEVMPLVTGLARSGVPLGILSNTCSAHWEFCISRYPFLTEFFSVHVRSDLAQSMKPDPHIYDVAIEEASVGADQIFFVDDKAENVVGAQRAGMNAIVFRSAIELAGSLRDRGVLFPFG